jgi:pimeloyl-ACP methyl ester carboxylesterase
MTTLEHDHKQTYRSHRVGGAAGCELYVEETGNPDGQPVLFIHGLSQSRLAWSNQLHSALARDFRLVAMDLRGHGRSERPHDAYGELFLWANDILAVINTLGLARPILCGWSYGGVVIGDYLRCHGERALGGIVLVDAVCMLGEPVMPFLGADFVGVFPGLFATDVDESSTGLQAFVRMCRSTDADPTEFYSILGYNSVVSPLVRQAMMSRTVDHSEVFAQLETPALIVHGLDDRVILPAMSEHLAGLMPSAHTSFYAGVGHSPFLESSQRFNDELRAFATNP